MKAFLLLCALPLPLPLTLSLLSAEPPAEGAKVEKKALSDDDRKAIERLRQSVAKVYKAAAKARQEGNVIDADPESGGTIPTPEGSAEVEHYLRLKRAYLSAKAALAKLEQREGKGAQK